MDNSSFGVIYFSLGSNVKSEDLTEEKIKIIIETFASLSDYKIIWKFESELKENLSNIKTFKWLPQQAILRKFL